MNIVKHKCHKHGHYNTDDGSGYVGLIEEQDDSEDKQNHRHQSSR